MSYEGEVGGLGPVSATSAHGRYHHFRDVAGQPVKAPRPLDSCIVMQWGNVKSVTLTRPTYASASPCVSPFGIRTLDIFHSLPTATDVLSLGAGLSLRQLSSLRGSPQNWQLAEAYAVTSSSRNPSPARNSKLRQNTRPNMETLHPNIVSVSLCLRSLGHTFQFQ